VVGAVVVFSLQPISTRAVRPSANQLIAFDFIRFPPFIPGNREGPARAVREGQARERMKSAKGLRSLRHSWRAVAKEKALRPKC
jgi:hypothetical protein